ncbi:thiol reductant ABC exporter subunit CydD [Ruicaihuangia caeni]|uniref:Thiol reductant ABC exporter subunit CydD n=1 Tax=Ruicaihuangia caeni TaxID=3042517 RepID=A0AAW6T6Q7_9MICO|nr:thiol reductant ABC exporter subunit CydD [Klugiella sp. YN-L-19]MDI2097780.1 thiol reductant ABC exporter subunit CydD [Klugiella sp. YN-L-19]
MRPFDPRLLRFARSARLLLASGMLIGIVQTAAIVGFAWALAGLVTGFIEGRHAFELRGLIALFAASVVVRALAAWLWELTGLAGAARVRQELRKQVLAAAASLGPDRLRDRSSTELATVAGAGLDSLDGYFARYLPQLLLTGIATPLLVVAMWSADPLSGVIVALALPLIPVFMVLIGLATSAVQRRQWEALQELARAFLEVVGGLATLILHGRQHRQVTRLRAVTHDYRRRTMRVLRVTFLSGFVLELAGSLSVALVAVTAGLRLVDGTMDFLPALFVLVLAPEVFLPVRNVGAQFHASADGMAAAESAFAIIEEAADHRAQSEPGDTDAARVDSLSAAAPAPPGLHVRGLTVQRGDQRIVDAFDMDAARGQVSAIAGESGAGKSTVLDALLGFAPASGLVLLDGAPLTLDRIAWAGQRPQLVAGPIIDNVTLGARRIDTLLVQRCLALTGLAGLPLERTLGPGGSGLSGGQAQRLAVARALYRLLERDLPLLLLDEPSSALDEAAETALISSLRELAAEGRIVVVVAHRESVLRRADAVVRVGALEHV